MSYTKDLTYRSIQSSVLTTNLDPPLSQPALTSWPGSRTGVRVEGFRQKIKAGLNASSPFSSDIFNVSWPRSSMKVEFTRNTDGAKFWHMYEGHMGTPSVFSHVFPETDASLDAAGLTKLYDRLKQERSYFNGLTFLGEFGQTIQMLRHPFSAMSKEVTKGFLSLDNRKRKILGKPYRQRRREWSKAVSGTILEINFGIKPLMSDIADIAKAAQKAYQEPPRRTRVSAVVGLESASYGAATPSTLIQPGYQLRYSSRTNVSSSVSQRHMVGVEIAEQGHIRGLMGIAELSGFTLENVIPTLYELTYCSWLLDYFTNLGDIITAGSTSQVGVKYYVRTTRRETTNKMIFTPVSSAAALAAIGFTQGRLSEDLRSREIVRRSVSRSVASSIPLPPLVFTHPGDSFSRSLNIISFLEQRRKSSRDLAWLNHF